LAQALAPPSRTPGLAPASVAAWPGLPKAPRAEMAPWASPSWPKRASAKATRAARTAILEYMVTVESGRDIVLSGTSKEESKTGWRL
jgi:hypothetical protein